MMDIIEVVVNLVVGTVVALLLGGPLGVLLVAAMHNRDVEKG